jgi:hypothetical protein
VSPRGRKRAPFTEPRAFADRAKRRELMSPRLEFRNYLLAATMNDRWESFREIIRGVRKRYGNAYADIDARRYLMDLATDGVHLLKERPRAGSAEIEFRLHVKQTRVANIPDPPKRESPLELSKLARELIQNGKKPRRLRACRTASSGSKRVTRRKS